MAATSPTAPTAIGVDILTGDDFESLLTVNGDLSSLLKGLKKLVKLQQSWTDSSLCAHFRQAIVAACTQQRTDPAKACLQFYQHSGREYCCLHMGMRSDRGQPIYGYFSFDDTNNSRLFLDNKQHFTDEPQARLGLHSSQLPALADFEACATDATSNNTRSIAPRAAHNEYAAPPAVDESEGITLLEGVEEMAELVVSRALRRAEKASPTPGAATGVHVMELVQKSKRKPQPKQWLKQVQNVLIADSRVTLDRQSQMWISTCAATSLGATATTNISSILSTSPGWATEVSNSIVERILKDPRGQPGNVAHVKQLSKQHAKDMTPQAWKRAVISALRKDARVRIEKKQIFPANRAASPSTSAVSLKPVSGSPSSAPPRASIVTYDALENAPTFAQIVRTQLSVPSNYYDSDDSDGDLDEWEDECKHDRFTISAASAMTTPPRLANQREDVPIKFAASLASQPVATVSKKPASRSMQVDNDWRQLFFAPRAAGPSVLQGVSVGDEQSALEFREAALLGTLSTRVRRALYSDADTVEPLFLNTHEPFCLCTVGVQGSGKSHTMGVVLESCLLPCDRPTDQPLVRLQRPMTALVLHYDQNVSSICEATGLIEPNRQLRRLHHEESPCALPRDRLVVLVSPSYYLQRLKFYGDSCIVKPLLFRWSTLSADHIKKIMRIKDGDSQLYVASMLELLRKYQRAGRVPDFQGFLGEVKAACKVPSQAAPLLQRAALLEALVAESTMNESLRSLGSDVLQVIGPGTLVVADLTDPLLASDEANGIFQVLVEQFRAAPSTANCGKLLALDEAHKFMDGSASDGLSNAIVNAARLMRHDGLRLAVSTQSPKALAPELLELVSVAVMHRFHSQDWFSYLHAKIPMPDSSLDDFMALTSGQALVFAANRRVNSMQAHDGRLLRVDVRARLTADRGASRTNVA